MKILIPKTYNTIIYDKKYEQLDYTIIKNLKYSKMAIYNLLKQLHQTDFFISKK